MLKLLVSLALTVFLVLFYVDVKNIELPVFQMTSETVIVAKGHSGHSLIVEVSYSHDGFEEWLQTLSSPYPLFLLDADWIERSEPTLKLIKEKQLPIGLLGTTSLDYEEDPDLLSKQLNVFKNAFDQLPLWFTTSDYTVPTALQHELFAQQINMLAPSMHYSFTQANAKLEDGEFIAIPLHRGENVQFESLSTFINEQPFLSIEENIFGYTISTKRYP